MAEAFGKYTLLRKLASGGMGEVFLAKQRGLEGFEKTLVIKRILAHHTDNADYIDMFFSEGRLAAKMSHSNIVQIYDMGETDGAYYIAMEYINGKSIKDMIDGAHKQRLPISPGHVADIVARLCSGLSYAHALTNEAGALLNIIHRDINPHNVLVAYGGEVKIIDFGIAKSAMNEHKTETGTIKGKFVYMSPEQSAAEKIDKRSDIFSVGIVLYEMLSGENPFQKANIVLSLDAIQRFDPPPPSTLNPDYGPFDAIIAKALAKRADDRYQDAADMHADLQRAMLMGELPRPAKTLAQYSAELFREQIEKEQRFIQEATKGQPNEAIAPLKPRPATGPDGLSRTVTGVANDDDGLANDTTPMDLDTQLHTTTTPSGPRRVSAAHSSVVRRRKKKTAVYSIVAGIVLSAAAIAAMMLLNANRQPTAFAHEAIVGEQLPPPPPMPNPTPIVTKVQENPTPPPVATPAPPMKAQATPQPAKAKHDRHAAKETKGESSTTAATSDDKLERVAVVGAEAGNAKPSEAKASGYFMLNALPAGAVSHDGHFLGTEMPLRVEIARPTGTIKIGDDANPFQVTFQYRIVGGRVDLAVDSKPWAIIKRGGIGIGKTPHTWFPAGDGPQRFEFVSPQVDGSTTVVVRYFNGQG